jgi:hypothetical protein
MDVEAVIMALIVGGGLALAGMVTGSLIVACAVQCL